MFPSPVHFVQWKEWKEILVAPTSIPTTVSTQALFLTAAAEMLDCSHNTGAGAHRGA
jgi:hypothetical protein